MRTPQQLYAEKRIVYHPELLTCPHCGELLVMWNSLAWDKTVQTLDRVLSIASRPSHCPKATCRGVRLRLLSAEAQRMALPGSTYGYDVLVRIGWLRQHQRATYSEIHTDLASRLHISLSHVRYLYQQFYLPLLACHERQQRDRLTQDAKAQGGVLIALDGLAPQAGEPQLWCIRELLTGLTLRSGWLSQQDQPTREAFLAPLKHLEWPILAVLSDKQTGLVPAVAAVLPNIRHQFYQAHYLRNLAEPLAEADAAFKVALRQTVREHLGIFLRQTPRTESGQAGLVAVTGLVLAEAGSGLVIQCLACFHCTLCRASVWRMASPVTRRGRMPVAYATSAARSRVQTLVGFPKVRGLWWSNALSCWRRAGVMTA